MIMLSILMSQISHCVSRNITKPETENNVRTPRVYAKAENFKMFS